LDAAEIAELVDGASLLFSNEYESALIERRTGWSRADVLSRVDTRVTTLGAAGARVERKDAEPVEVEVVPVEHVADPTGVGDAFRAGYLAGQSLGLSVERTAQLGCLVAAHVVETVGTQEYHFTRAEFVARMAKAYGDDAAAEVESVLPMDR
jgi:adenosine kinase